MAGLQVLEEELSGQGFHVLGFFSNNFGNQAGSSEDIDACNAEHAVSFPEFEIAHVIDPDGGGPELAQPVFDWILAQPSPGPEEPLAPTWNFHKYLIDREGNLMAHFAQAEYWGDDPSAPAFEASPVVQAIRAALAE